MADTLNPAGPAKASLFKRHWDKPIIAVVLVVVSLQFFDYILSNERMPQGDAISHSAWAARLYRVLAGEKNASVLGGCGHPPLTQLVSCVSFSIFGLSIRNALMSQYFFYLILLLSIYGMGAHFGGRRGGIAALFLGGSYPFFMVYSLEYLIDIPGAATGLLAFLLLFKTRWFEHRRYAILFGVALALSMMTKWTNLFFVGPPLFVVLLFRAARSFKGGIALGVALGVFIALAAYYYYLGSTIHNDPSVHYVTFFLVCLWGVVGTLLLQRAVHRKCKAEERDKILPVLNGILSLFTAATVASPTYLFQVFSFVSFYHRQKELSVHVHFDQNVPAYLYTMIWSFSSAGLLVVAGLILAVVLRERRRDFALIGLSILVGVVMTSLSGPTDFRYVVLVPGLLAVLGGSWVSRLGRWSLIPLAGLGLFFLLPFTAYFWRTPDLPVFHTGTVPTWGRLVHEYRLAPFRMGRPRSGRDPLEDIMRLIQDHYKAELRSLSPRPPLVIKSLITRKFEQHTFRHALQPVRDDFLFYSLEYFQYRELVNYHEQHDIHAAIREPRFAAELKRTRTPQYLVVLYVAKKEMQDLVSRVNSEVGRSCRMLKWYALPGKRNAGILLVGGG